MVYNDCVDSSHRFSESIRDLGFLKQENVPLDLVGSTFIQLFTYLLSDQGKLCLGLYRRDVHHGQSVWFVCVNPSPDTILRKDDAVFLFGGL